MKEKNKLCRELAKISVFTHLFSSVLSVIFSGLVSTIVLVYYQLSAESYNINIFSADPKVYKMTLTVTLLAALINLPLSFCAERFFLIISGKAMNERATVKEFFEPFGKPGLLLKGTLLVFLTTLLNFLGVAVLVLPVYFTYCMSVFILSENPDISPFKAMALSRRMMKGHKWAAFCTVLPVLAVELLMMPLMSSPLFSVIIYVVQALFYVTVAMFYNLSKDKTNGAVSE